MLITENALAKKLDPEPPDQNATNKSMYHKTLIINHPISYCVLKYPCIGEVGYYIEVINAPRYLYHQNFKISKIFTSNFFGTKVFSSKLASNSF